MFPQSNEASLLLLPHEMPVTVPRTFTDLDLSSTFPPTPQPYVGGTGCSFNRFSSHSVFLDLYFIITPYGVILDIISSLPLMKF